MAKQIVLALAFAALVAFASAHTTVITTTIESENPQSQQCSRQLQGQRFNQCQRYLQQQGFGSIFGGENPQQCCQELMNIHPQCQCEAIEEVYWRAQEQQGGFLGSMKIQQLKQKAQQLPNQCNLQVRQCPIRTTVATTATTTRGYSPRTGSQQCQHVQRQSFNQCQRYIQQQIGSQGSPFDRQQPQGQGMQQCCNELERVERECQCEAMQQVYRQAQQQQQYQQQGSRRGGRQQPMQDVQQVIQQLRNQCDLQVQQCRIPSAMF